MFPQIPGDIEKEVKEKYDKMAGMGLPLQPFVIAVGSKIEEISKVYVRADATTYEVLSLLKGLDINLLIKPESFFIGEISDNKKDGRTTVWTKKSCTGQFVPMRRVLQMFLELPNVYEEIKGYMHNEISSKSNGVHTSIFHGKLWSDISESFIDKIVIPLYLYYDDFEVCDPLSSAKGIHKVGGLYYSIAAMPPKYSSNLDNIFLAQFIYSTDHRDFQNEKCFHKVIEEFKYLYEHGISISGKWPSE